jgi:A/G-specific adenine glycosylase
MGGLPPADFNQAIMEFGAIQCKPQSPDCNTCPLQNSCFAFSKMKVNRLPVKEKKLTVRKRYFNYLFIRNGKGIYMHKRTGNDIWKNMYDFPLIETTKRISPRNLLQHGDLKKYFGKEKYSLADASSIIKHQLSHQTIFARFFIIDTSAEIKMNNIQSLNKKAIQKLAVPRLIEKYLATSGHL